MIFQISLGEALHSTHESIEYLKQNIIDRKKAIKRKKAALKAMCTKTERYHKTVEELKVFFIFHIKHLTSDLPRNLRKCNICCLFFISYYSLCSCIIYRNIYSKYVFHEVKHIYRNDAEDTKKFFVDHQIHCKRLLTHMRIR